MSKFDVLSGEELERFRVINSSEGYQQIHDLKLNRVMAPIFTFPCNVLCQLLNVDHSHALKFKNWKAL